jgi:hypothetical protein
MSTFAYGLITGQRVAADSGASEQAEPPGTKSYVDTLAALVPAEVLGIWAALVIPNTVTSDDGEAATSSISDPGLMRWSFWTLLALSALIYVIGRLRTARWVRTDFIRILIPPAAFTIWMLLQRPSVFDLIASNWSAGARDVAGGIGAAALAAVAGALAYKANADDAQRS